MNIAEIKQKLNDFIIGGDRCDLDLLEQTLHKNYRNVQSGFFEKEGIFELNKTDYKLLIQNGTFGGVPRKMQVKRLEIFGYFAYCQVHLESKNLRFNSLIMLIHDEGKWWVVGNYPSIENLVSTLEEK